jgi:transcriptional regulator with XRE-family HTH domain
MTKDFQSEDARYAYADAVTNAFVSAQIKALREDRKLSQTDLAILIGTKQSGVSRLEKADYSSWKIGTLRKLSKAFHVRLRISFEPFGSLPEDLGRFDTKHLAPHRFEVDPAFNKPEEQPEESIAGLQWPTGEKASPNTSRLIRTVLACAERSVVSDHLVNSTGALKEMAQAANVESQTSPNIAIVSFLAHGAALGSGSTTQEPIASEGKTMAGAASPLCQALSPIYVIDQHPRIGKRSKRSRRNQNAA